MLSDDRRYEFCDAIEYELSQNNKHNKRTVEKLAESFGIFNKNLTKEMTELAVARLARKIASNESISTEERYQQIVELYHNQVNLSHRTSQSMMFQQYSTPAPISYVASLFVLKNTDSMYFEPSAGNGLLTIALPYDSTTVNELDDVRLENLRSQNFVNVMNQDATIPFTKYRHYFDGVVTNPPFGTLLQAEDYDSFPISTLDHLMALRALDCMKNDGRAAIIIGGHTNWDKEGRVQAGKNRLFFNYLYSHYNVVDVILIDGHKLYSRQGTSFDVRLILIDGRKEYPFGVAPLRTDFAAEVVVDFDTLWNRVFDSKYQFKRDKSDVDSIIKLKMKMKAKSLQMNDLGNANAKNQYSKDVNEFFENKLAKPFITLGKPNEILISCGLSNNDIVITKRTIHEKVNKHLLTIDHLLNLDEKINNPLLVFQSEKIGDSVLIIVEDFNHEGLLSIAVHIDSRIDYNVNVVNRIATINGRRLSQVLQYLDDGALLYNSNIKRIKDFLMGSQFNSAQSEKILSRIQRYKRNAEKPKK